MAALHSQAVRPQRPHAAIGHVRHLQNCKSRMAEAFFVLLVSLAANPVHAFRGVLEGDTSVELYVNGVIVRKDASNPVLPLNSERRHDANGADAYPVYMNSAFSVGDVIALKVHSTRFPQYNVTDATFKTTSYNAKSGAIAAFEDGTLTNTQWKCSWVFETGWLLQTFVDGDWPFAVVDDNSVCCPWRDPANKWGRLNAKWIRAVVSQTQAASNDLYCRYTKTNQQLIDGSHIHAASSAPFLNTTAIQFGLSAADVSFTINRRSHVYCLLIDARFLLRDPSPLEVEARGASLEVTGWADVTVGNYLNHYNITGLTWYQVATAQQCQSLCDSYTSASCTAITFFTSGVDPSALKNCKLLPFLNNNLLSTVSLAPLNVRHYVRLNFPVATTLSVPGLLFPGTIYNSYCSARDVGTSEHSTWNAVKASRLTSKTVGCANCGAQPAPVVKIMGGWATSSQIVPVVWSSKPGRVFCAARALPSNTSSFSLTITDIKAQSIDQSKQFNLIVVSGTSAFVRVSSLTPSTLYEVACMAEGDNGEQSTQQNLDDTRLRWLTEAAVVSSLAVPIQYMAVVQSVVSGATPTISMTLSARMSVMGFLWCQVVNASSSSTSLFPIVLDKATLMASGALILFTDVTQDVVSIFGGLSTTFSYQVFCTGRYDDFSNATLASSAGLLGPAYPVVSILSHTVNVNEVRLLIQLDKGPASTFCLTVRWGRRPFTSRPPSPTIADMRSSLNHKNTFNVGVAATVMMISDLATGSLYDVYCYSEEYQTPPPPGSSNPAPKAMPISLVLQTRFTIRTGGPRYSDGGWTCIAGHPCSIHNIQGEGLTKRDQVIVQQHQCTGRCRCNGQEDADRKGASCSAVSHLRHINPPDPQYQGIKAVDAVDPNGPWCYVDAGTCYDQRSSPTFPSLIISYQVCTFQATQVGVSGSGILGFPFEGVGQLASTSGSAYNFGTAPVVAGGWAYQVCWCNGTSSPCATLADFNLKIGLLHIAGPSVNQKGLTLQCTSGQPCTIRYFQGHALQNGNRLVVLPETAQGCGWQRAYPSDPASIPGFPNNATSERGVDLGKTFSWGNAPLRADGGTYLLCWCGTFTGTHHTRSSDCIFPRPLTGDSYLAPAGRMSIRGPTVGTMRTCIIGVACIVANVLGNGLQGGDRVAILDSCGVASTSPPTNWDAGVQGMSNVPAQFISGGWMTYGTPLANSTLRGLAAPPLNNLGQLPRGVWGVPNRGISLPDARVGYFAWGAATQTIPGEYTLCWCPSGVGLACDMPAHFQVMISMIRFRGPLVYPGASQMRGAVRNRALELSNFSGLWPAAGGQLFIASGVCGSPAVLGAPQKGISSSSVDGKSFRWGADPLSSAPGVYRLCWCFTQLGCSEASQFTSFAGLLSVKSPYGPMRQFHCAIEQPCMIRNVSGEGSNSMDQVMVMGVCGSGDSVDSGFYGTARSKLTGPDGTWFELPHPKSAGSYRLCWCAGEVLCYRGADFDFDLGNLIVGGPNKNIIYRCYAWTPCSIQGMIGTSLSDGDRLMVVFGNNSCSSSSLQGLAVPGFPQGGLGSLATNAGRTHSWGADRVRSFPGVYTLCMCSVLVSGGSCNQSNAAFSVDAGQMRIGTFSEYEFLNRPPEPNDRSQDMLYAFLLIAPLTLAGIGATMCIVKKFNDLRVSKREVVGQNPFPVQRAWAWEEQEIMKTKHDVKQLSYKRELALGMADQVVEEKGATMLAIPDLSGITAYQEKRTEVQAFKDVEEQQLAVEDVADVPEALMDDVNAAQFNIQIISADPGPASIHQPTTQQAPEELRESSRSEQAAAPVAPNDRFSAWSRIRSSFASLRSQAPAPLDLEVREVRQTHAERHLVRAQSLQTQLEVEEARRTRLIDSPTHLTRLRNSSNPEDGPPPPDVTFNFVQDPDRQELILRVLDL